MKKIAVCFILAALTAMSLMADLLLDFNAGAKVQWWLAPGHAAVSYENGGMTVTLKKATRSEAYPRIRLSNETLPVKDWSLFERIAFDLESPTGGKFTIQISDGKGGGFILPFDLKPGEKIQVNKVLSRAAYMKWGSVRQFAIVAARNAQDMVIQFSSIRLLPFTASQTAAGGYQVIFNARTDTGKVTKRNRTSLVPGQWPTDNTSNCARAVFLPNEAKAGNPGIILKPPLIPEDWNHVEQLELELESPTGADIYVGTLYAPKGEQFTNFRLRAGGGRQFVKIPVNEIARKGAKVTEFHFVSERAVKDVVVYIGDMRLKMSNPETLADSARARLKNLSVYQPDNKSQARIKTMTGQVGKVSNWPDFMKKIDVLTSDVQLSAIQRIRGNAELFAGWMPSDFKIHREKQVFSELPKAERQLDAARNEGEGMQLVLLPRQTLHNVAVRAVLEGFPADCVWIAPVGYVNCEQPCHEVERTGWWPDPILRYTRRMDLEKEKLQAYYLDVNVPENQTPGLYRGKVEIRWDNGQLTVSFTLRVRRFVMDMQKLYPTTFSCNLLTGGHPYAQVKDHYAERRRQAEDLLLDHRLTPTSLFSDAAPAAETVKHAVSRGAKAFVVMYMEDRHRHRIPAVQNAMADYRKAGVDAKAIIFGYDECPPEKYNELVNLTEKLKQHFPALPYSSTMWDPSFGNSSVLKDAVDIWIPTMPRYAASMKEIKKARMRGKKVWWYWAVNLPPLPDTHIENEPMQARLLAGALAWKYQTDGLLYWSTIHWMNYIRQPDGSFKRKPFERFLTGAPLTNWPVRYYKFNGEGNLIYPQPEGLVPSLRLKFLRDGTDDYILFAMLDEQVKEVRSGKRTVPVNWLSRAEKELAVEPQIAETLTQYSVDPSRMDAKRHRLMDLLDMVSRHSSGH